MPFTAGSRSDQFYAKEFNLTGQTNKNQIEIEIVDGTPLHAYDKLPEVSSKSKSKLVQDESGAWHDTRTFMFTREQLQGTPNMSTRQSAASGVTAIKDRLGVGSAQTIRK